MTPAASDNVDKGLREAILKSWYKEFPKRMNSDHMPEDLLTDLVAIITSREQALLDRVEKKVISLCDYCYGKGYVETNGMAMEDDLVEKIPCEECEPQRQALNTLRKGGL